MRRLDELRVRLAEVTDVAARDFPWAAVRIDCTTRSWEGLYVLGRLFLGREWQAAIATRGPGKASRCFSGDDLFEAYVAALAKRALRGSDLTANAQGGGLLCLVEVGEGGRLRDRKEV